MKVSSSSTERAKSFKENHIPPLTAQFFSNLIKLETDFINKQYTAETLDKLTEYYAEAVEYYDSHKDPISTYFIFKIQDMLTTKKSLKLLMNEQAKAHSKESAGNNSVSTATPPDSAGFLSSPDGKTKSGMDSGIPVITETMGDNSSSSEAEEEEEDKVKDLVGKKHHHHHHRKKPELSMKNASGKSIVALKNMKQKLFSLQLKVQKEKAHEKQNLTEVLQTFTKCCQHNDGVVTKDIMSQRNRIRNRVAKKTKEGFISQTHSSSGFFQFRGDLTIESMLRGLEDDDSGIQNPLSNSGVNEEGSEGNQKAQGEGLTIL